MWFGDFVLDNVDFGVVNFFLIMVDVCNFFVKVEVVFIVNFCFFVVFKVDL